MLLCKTSLFLLVGNLCAVFATPLPVGFSFFRTNFPSLNRFTLPTTASRADTASSSAQNVQGVVRSGHIQQSSPPSANEQFFGAWSQVQIPGLSNIHPGPGTLPRNGNLNPQNAVPLPVMDSVRSPLDAALSHK